MNYLRCLEHPRYVSQNMCMCKQEKMHFFKGQFLLSEVTQKNLGTVRISVFKVSSKLSQSLPLLAMCKTAFMILAGLLLATNKQVDSMITYPSDN